MFIIIIIRLFNTHNLHYKNETMTTKKQKSHRHMDILCVTTGRSFPITVVSLLLLKRFATKWTIFYL